MAFMTLPDHSERDDRPPVLAYNAKAGRLFVFNRAQDATGEWITHKIDITMSLPAFAVDFGRLETGWIHFSQVAPLWSMAFYGQPVPAQPDSPGSTAAGKPLRFKAGFRIPVLSQAIGGLREFAGNAGALITGMNELHTAYEQAPEARADQIPLVKMTDVMEVRAGQSTSFQPVFSVVRWVPRPADRLGPRMVPFPGAPAPRPQAATSPLARLAGTRTAQPVNDAPPDRWDDERWDAPVRELATASSMASWAGVDDEIPF